MSSCCLSEYRILAFHVTAAGNKLLHSLYTRSHSRSQIARVQGQPCGLGSRPASMLPHAQTRRIEHCFIQAIMTEDTGYADLLLGSVSRPCVILAPFRKPRARVINTVCIGGQTRPSFRVQNRLPCSVILPLLSPQAMSSAISIFVSFTRGHVRGGRSLRSPKCLTD